MSIYWKKGFVRICIAKVVINKNIFYQYSFPHTWPLYCRMTGFIENVGLTYYLYCKCRFAKKRQKLCDICNFNKDLWIFYKSELTDKPKKKQKSQRFTGILKYWNSMKPDYTDRFDYSKERNHKCFVNINYCI